MAHLPEEKIGLASDSDPSLHSREQPGILTRDQPNESKGVIRRENVARILDLSVSNKEKDNLSREDNNCDSNVSVKKNVSEVKTSRRADEISIARPERNSEKKTDHAMTNEMAHNVSGEDDVSKVNHIGDNAALVVKSEKTDVSREDDGYGFKLNPAEMDSDVSREDNSPKINPMEVNKVLVGVDKTERHSKKESDPFAINKMVSSDSLKDNKFRILRVRADAVPLRVEVEYSGKR